MVLQVCPGSWTSAAQDLFPRPDQLQYSTYQCWPKQHALTTARYYWKRIIDYKIPELPVAWAPTLNRALTVCQTAYYQHC